MRKIYEIARREFVETVKTKTFLLGLLIIPIIIGGVVLFGQYLGPRQGGPRTPIRVGVTCAAPELAAKIETAFVDYNQAHPLGPITLSTINADGGSAEEQGKEQLRQSRLDAYVVLAGDLAGTGGTIQFYTYKLKPSGIDALQAVEFLLRETIINWRYEARGLDRRVLQEIQNVPFQRVELGETQGQEQVQGKGQQVARMMVPFAFMYLMFMGIVGMGQHMITSIIEEKNSRIIEVLLAAVSPFELMAGKIAGLAVVGLTVVALWGAAGYATARWQGIRIEVGGTLLAYGLIYYILGFVLFSAILAGVGSICNTIKETQSLMMPIMLVFVVPLLAWLRLAQEPNGTLARVLSYVPPATPMVMIVRLSSGFPVWIGETLLSIFVLVTSVLVTIWLAAKVFRTGILLYGKRPGPREILRWLRAG